MAGSFSSTSGAGTSRTDGPELRLSVLDQSPVREGGTPADALQETIALAQHVDRLGYSRYWLAEHHGTDGLAGPAPEIMVTRVAAATESIRVGSGGVMLSHYSPYKVAENFLVLENMFPGRIDLGIGRAPGSDFRTAAALAYGNQLGIEHFPERVRDLSFFLSGALPADHPLGGVRATPTTETQPELWMLASSAGSTTIAAELGFALSFAHFIAPEHTKPCLDYYRTRFKPSDRLAAPLSSLGVFVLCADTAEEAEKILSSRDLHRLRADRGEIGPLPSPETAQAYEYSPMERRQVEFNRMRSIWGTPETVQNHLLSLAREYGVDELVVLSNCYDFNARKRSYELLAEVCGLPKRDSGKRDSGKPDNGKRVAA